jgi:outer membrane protein OmpA-like peptidoglycan-associated protein
MIKARQGLTCTIAILSVFVLSTSGCATKKYVNQQISPVNQRLGQFEKQTDDRIAWLTSKQQGDMAQVNQRMAATDQKLSQVAQVATAAQAAAAQANEANAASRSAEEMEIVNAANSAVASALNYQLVDKADVTFGFNKANLTPSAKRTLDDVIIKVQAAPRAVVELAGFTDPIGSSDYNLGLSRRRAWVVQRYLVEHNVPVRSIHIVGMGKEPPPTDLAPVSSASAERVGRRDDYRRERRVNIRVFRAGEVPSTSGTEQ